MDAWRIEILETQDGLVDELGDRIYEFNVQMTGMDDGREIAAALRDDDGDLVAGLTGWTWARCCFIDQLWVRADHRNNGIGTQLLDAAEAEARSRGCVLVIVSTFSFQSPGFYERKGYVERGRIEGHPPGHADILFAKDL